MKKLIEFYYNLNIDSLRTYGEEYLFNSNNKLYLFYKLRDFDSVENMKYILNNYNNIYMHKPIFNKENQLTTYDGEGYRILFFVNILKNRIINYKDIAFFNNYFQVDCSNSVNNWEIMWKRKIDFLESYIEKKDNVNVLIIPLCYYYIGLAENAINYLKKIPNYFRCSISHKRINYNDTLIELYNPINFIIDNKCRDICEYIKSVADSKININIDEIVNSLNYSEVEYELLISRLLFPSNFFDKLDLLNDNRLSKNDVIKMYDYTIYYEKFLFSVFNTIKKIRNIRIPNINWIK